MAGGADDDTEPTRGFRFPGRFEVTIVGDAQAQLEARVGRWLADAGLPVVPNTTRCRRSRAGKYVSVTVTIVCPTRGHYEAAHALLRAHDGVRYTL